MSVLKRKDAAPESTWQPEIVFASWADWDTEYEEAIAGLPALAAYDGKLTDSQASLVDWLELYENHWQRVRILTSFVDWANMVDNSDSEAKARTGQAAAIASKFQAACAFMDPQLLEIGDDLLTWAKEEARLTPYTHYFNNLLRLKKNQRSAEIEQLLSRLSESFDGTFKTYSELTNTDLKFQDAIDSQGENHPIFQATLGTSGQSAD
ncbi:MAG: hypothetical protein N2D54_07240, partial [Chloroflexota bacterium]